MNKRRASKFLRTWAVVILGAATVWFFSRVWVNVSMLASRTLPGVALAAEMSDRAASMELSRNGTQLDPRDQAAIREVMDSYEATIAVEQDRLNFANVERAYAAYVSAPSRESWFGLRGEIKVLLSFRLERAQLFASDSRERFTAALGVNIAGLALFVVLLAIVSLVIALGRMDDDRPENF